MHRPNEALKIDNDESNDTDLTAFLHQHENDESQVYDADFQSNEDSFDEVGQELMNFLVRTGKLKEKSPPIPTAELARRHERTKNDRYDELIDAFNVILEEIVLHGSLRFPSSKHVEEHMNTERDADVKSDVICSKNGKESDHLNRCLNPIEKELLDKIKTLTNQLNSAMRKMHKSKIE